MVYTTIDLCCGTGALGKSFERTGFFKNILAADYNPNHQNLYKMNFGETAFDDVSDEKLKKYIKTFVDYDILLAGLNGLEESVIFDVLDIFDQTKPKAMVLEFDVGLLHQSLVRTCELFCRTNGYYATYETLNPFDFGILSIARRTVFITIREDCFNGDPNSFQITKSKKWKDFENKEVDYDDLMQSRGFDWGFPDFKFLVGTPEQSKKTIMRGASFMPMMSSIAFDLLDWLK